MLESFIRHSETAAAELAMAKDSAQHAGGAGPPQVRPCRVLDVVTRCPFVCAGADNTRSRTVQLPPELQPLSSACRTQSFSTYMLHASGSVWPASRSLMPFWCSYFLPDCLTEACAHPLRLCMR